MYESESVWRDVDAYFVNTLVPEDEALLRARESGARTTMPRAEVAPNQGRLLGLLCAMTGARRVLEFGTLAGYSTIWLARAVGAAGHVTTLELEERNAAIARENLERAGVADWVEVRTGPAGDSARRLIADAVIDPDSDDVRVRGVRSVLADIAGDERLEATALQTVGVKGWDGFTLIRRAF